MTKAEIRAQTQIKVALMHPEDIATQSDSITQQILEFPLFRDSGSIAIYFSTAQEVNINAIIDTALAKKIAVYCPFFDKKTNQYTWAHLKKRDTLIPSKYGILQPEFAITTDTIDVGAIFVPGVAFDRFGNRIGHGMGIYDRLLSTAKGIKVGCCLTQQLVPHIESDTHDIKMDYLVTPNALFNTLVNH